MKVKELEDEVEQKRRQVANLKVDTADFEAIKKLKGSVRHESFFSSLSVTSSYRQRTRSTVPTPV
jgi:hypothetical protein